MHSLSRRSFLNWRPYSVFTVVCVDARPVRAHKSRMARLVAKTVSPLLTGGDVVMLLTTGIVCAVIGHQAHAQEETSIIAGPIISADFRFKLCIISAPLFVSHEYVGAPIPVPMPEPVPMA
jgi:hypothetical protein